MALSLQSPTTRGPAAAIRAPAARRPTDTRLAGPASSADPVGLLTDSRRRRAVDVVVAIVGLVLAAPLLAGIAVAVRLTSRGPAIYRQERIGRFERTFVILKFRSMRTGSDRVGPLVSGARDPRVTWIGRRLRDSRLDELPQLVNLLRGDLTLIGPRPEVARYVAYYTAAERQLLAVRPGIIGPDAVMFATEQAARLDRDGDPERMYLDECLHPRLAADLDYLAHRGLRRDLALLVRAGGVVLAAC